MESKLQAILDSAITATPEAVDLVFHVESPFQNISWTSVAGISDTETKNKLKENQPVPIASITKTIVAVAIL
jgi:CubicO group peptidase (beta-lactamase class C family)